MDAFVSKKRKVGTATESSYGHLIEHDEDSTDVKLAILASLSSVDDADILLEALLVADGSVEAAAEALNGVDRNSPRKRRTPGNGIGYQSSLHKFRKNSTEPVSTKQLTKKGKTLHLYAPDDIARHTPCSIIHNFLPTEVANALLGELLIEAPTFGKEVFNLFDKVVTSPHTMCFYVDEWEEAERQKTDYVYNGAQIADVRKTPTQMRRVSSLVAEAVNREIQKRINLHYPDQKKLKYQSPKPWVPNTAFVNCYDGGKESVGYHSDQLTYLGPRAVIGSLSLGVAREFRVRRVVARDGSTDTEEIPAKKDDSERADTEGQIAIHLPHNSLLVMHAEMQEEWKHSIAPAQSIDPHPIARNKRINVTYRCYRECFHPKYTPKCHCGIATVLRCVQRRQETKGKYMWMCHAGYTPGRTGCTFFKWAEFDDDGEPPWAQTNDEIPKKMNAEKVVDDC